MRGKPVGNERVPTLVPVPVGREDVLSGATPR